LSPGLKSANLGLAVLAALGVALYSAVVGLLLWSYLACFLTQPGHVPPSWHPFQDAEVWWEGVLAGNSRGCRLLTAQDRAVQGLIHLPACLLV
jgi:hypothetical protein